MGRKCPIYGIAIYMDCIDCDYKLCNMKYKYDTICIGIDQSYSNTGISVSADGILKMVGSINLLNYNNNSKKRKVIYNKIKSIINKLIGKSKNIVCVIERIRLRSQGFLNINYIKSIGALNALIVDLMYEYNIKVYSVDTRCWKSQVVGTSKPKQNDYGVPDEKWPTVEWCISKGFKSKILVDMSDSRKVKGTFIIDGCKYMYDNDAADSAAISMFWFVGEHDKLKEEN